jgi:transcription elongation factor Elf1
MAEPTCLKCGHDRFQMTPVDLGRQRHKHSLIHCAQCGGVIGVVDEINVEATLQEARGFIQRHFSALRERVRPQRNGKQQPSSPRALRTDADDAA